MSPRCMLSIWFSHVWRRRVWSLITLLFTLLVSWAALADDNPYHDPELCVRGGQTVTIDGKQYARININAHLEQSDPRKCSLRSAYPMYPIYESGKPLGQQEWLRSVYAANQGSHPTVLRRCVPNSSPSPAATAEELAECPHSFINYMDVPSNGWIAWILIPRQPVATWGERQMAAAKTACSVATSPEAKKACQEAGYGQSENPQSPIVVVVPAFESQLNAALAQLSRKFSEDSLRLAITQNKMLIAIGEKETSYWRILASLWVIAYCLSALGAAWKIRSLKKQLREARHQKTMPTGATLALQNKRLQEELEKANQTIQRLSQDHKLDKDLLQQQHNAELLGVNRGWQERFDEAAAGYNRRLEAVTKEVADRNKDIADRDGVIAAKDNIIADQEGQLAAWRYRHKTAIYEGEERIGQEAARADELDRKLALLETGQSINRNELERKHSADLAEKDALIGQLRNEIKRLEAANDNAAKPQPSSTETTTPSTVTTSASKETDLTIDAKYQATLNMERAIHDYVTSVLASSSDLEKLAVDAGVQTIVLQRDLEYVCYCKQIVEQDLAAKEAALAAKDGELNGKVIELSELRSQHVQLQLLYSLSQIALQKVVGSDCTGEGSLPPESGGAIARALNQGLGTPRVPADIEGDGVPAGIVPAGREDREGPEITFQGDVPSGWSQEPYTEPDHSQVVARPDPPHTPTIPIVSLSTDKKVGS